MVVGGHVSAMLGFQLIQGMRRMAVTITSVVHRHVDQHASALDLVLEVGLEPPIFYGRRLGRKVVSIERGDPLRCKLEDGDVISIGGSMVRYINRV